VKRLGGSALLALLGLTACGGGDAAGSDSSDLKARDAHIESTVDLDVLEASGLGRRLLDNGDIELLAIGDSAATLAISDDAEAESFAALDLEDVVGDAGGEGSQWEAVASDGTGRVFLLRERPAALLVLDADLGTLLTEIALDASNDPDVGEDWRDDSNSLAEGLILLQNGHILVAKEKDPPALIELGPEGDAPQGFGPGEAATDTTFPLSSSATFIALHSWPLSSSAKKAAPDISDLATDPDGALYLLSDEGRLIARLEASLGPDEAHAKLATTWKLPKKAKKAEGLVFLPDHAALVAIDTDDTHDNGYVLSPLD
jgi:hypothetical protein